MTTRDLIVFTAIGSFIILGSTGVAWIFFVKWYKAEEKAKQARREK